MYSTKLVQQQSALTVNGQRQQQMMQATLGALGLFQEPNADGEADHGAAPAGDGW